MSELTERQRDLWNTVLEEHDKLGRKYKQYGSRSSAYWSNMKNGEWQEVLTESKFQNSDGTNDFYIIKAYYTFHDENKIETQTRLYLDSADWFWAEKIEWEKQGFVPNRDKHFKDFGDRNKFPPVRVNNSHYVIGDPAWSTDKRSFLGYGGHVWYIQFLDNNQFRSGHIIKTNNLWHQGTIPPKFREQLPDNARFLTPEEATGKGYFEAVN